MISTDNLLVEKLNRLIDDNLDNPAFTVDSICQEIGISRSQLHRNVKEQTGLSISLYIRKRRLLKARHLLQTTELRISEIGDVVGINNPQNFSTYFIEEFKVSPTEFRKLDFLLAGVNQPLPTPETAPVGPAQPTSEKPVDAPKTRSRFLPGRRWISFGIMSLLLIGAGLYGWLENRPARPPVQPVINSLAVLPFTNLGDDESGSACEEIMDEVHTSVSLIKNLKVISRSSSDQYKDTKKSIWQIGDELQVANILKGRVLKTGNQLQVKVEIIGTQNNRRVWTQTYSAAFKDIFALTNQIVEEVARQLKLTISTSTTEKLAQARTRSIEAYNFFLQGRQLMVTRTKANVLESITRFNQALALDSTFAEAHALKAEAYLILLDLGYTDAKKAYQLTERSALTAIRFDPTNSTAYAVLGNLYHDTYQWQAAENSFRIALQHNPNDAQANYWYSLLLRSLGRLDEAIRYSTEAVSLDPLYPVIMAGHTVNCIYGNRFDLAEASIKNGQGLFDNSFLYYTVQGYLAMTRKNYDRAVMDFQKGIDLNPDYKRPASSLIYCDAKRGNRRRALTYLHNLTEITPRADYDRAVVYAGLGDTDKCLNYLKKAADAGYIYRDMKIYPVFKPYWSHPVFKAILHQYKLPDA